MAYLTDQVYAIYCICSSLTLSVGGGPILDHASLKIYGAKPSGQISSNQNGYCP